jgi:hypothetical protein
MDKYMVKYTDKSGDLSSVWVYAGSKEEAKQNAKNEYWDIVDIVMVSKL